jgi:hypothetical protein
MAGVIVLFVLVAAVIDFVIAAVAVGSVVARQMALPAVVVYDLDEAVETVADNLPESVASTVSYDDVRHVLLHSVEFMRRKGVLTTVIEGATTDDAVVVDDEEPLAYVLGELDREDRQIADDHVAAILVAHGEYYRSIGALGDRIEPDEN